MSNTVGTLTDLATNTKTNLVGAINELADFDEFTVTETVYNFTTSKRNVMLRANNDDPELNSCELHGTSNGQVITVYCPIAGNGRNSKDVIIYNYRESVGASVGQCVIAIGESRTFTYVNGYLNDASVSAAKSIDYGTKNYIRMSKPAKRYYVEASGTSTTQIQITGLDIERDKEYYIRFGAALTPNGDDPLYGINFEAIKEDQPVNVAMGAQCQNGYWYYGQSNVHASLSSGVGNTYFTGTMRIVQASIPGIPAYSECASYSGEGYGHSGSDKQATQLYGVVGETLNSVKLSADGGTLVAGSFIEITTV